MATDAAPCDSELWSVATRRGATWGPAAALLLVALAFLVPPLTGWEVQARLDDRDLPPLHGFVEVKLFGPGTLPAVALALLGWWWAAGWCARLAWPRLLLAVYAAGLAWLLALALVDGSDGLTRALGNQHEYLRSARAVGDVPAMLDGFVDRIPYAAAPDNWPTHVAGHPPGAVLLFVGLVRIGLGGDLAAGLSVTVVAATTPVAVLVALRLLGAESAARRAAPFLALGPAAVFTAVSADAAFTAFAAWGLAALAVAATRGGWGSVVWAAVAGLLLGWCALLSYGLPLLGFLVVAVLAAARAWCPLPVAVAAALAVVLGFAAAGFAWWEAWPVLHERYWDGIAADRPAAYWLWGNLAALVLAAGPVLGAALVAGLARPLRACGADRVVLLLAGAAAAAVLVADLSRMSKGEVERIWLPFVPWLLVATALLPDRWLRPALAIQLVTALVVQHLLYTSW